VLSCVEGQPERDSSFCLVFLINRAMPPFQWIFLWCAERSSFYQADVLVMFICLGTLGLADEVLVLENSVQCSVGEEDEEELAAHRSWPPNLEPGQISSKTHPSVPLSLFLSLSYCVTPVHFSAALCSAALFSYPLPQLLVPPLPCCIGLFETYQNSYIRRLLSLS
jgi:hypothetical protein